VSRSDLSPISFTYDWHVQPICQRPKRLPPERRALGIGRRVLADTPPSSKPYELTAKKPALSNQRTRLDNAALRRLLDGARARSKWPPRAPGKTHGRDGSVLNSKDP
jgi:hypothetical protein